MAGRREQQDWPTWTSNLQQQATSNNRFLYKAPFYTRQVSTAVTGISSANEMELDGQAFAVRHFSVPSHD